MPRGTETSSQHAPVTPSANPKAGRWLALAARLFLGGVLVYASADKLLHPSAFAEVIHNYRILPDTLIDLTAILLPALELVLGCALLAGIWLAGGACIVAGLLSAFFLIIVFNLARGLNVDCGCFTSAGGPASQGEMIWYVVRDAVFLLPAFFLGHSARREAASPPAASRPPAAFRSRAVRQGALLLILSGALGLGINALRPTSLPLVGDWSPKGQLALGNGESLSISLDEAEQAFATGKGYFLDARPAEAYEERHIEGAISLPWEQFDALFNHVMGSIPRTALIITYCDGEGCGLSKELAKELWYRGYENVRVLVNGWHLWVVNHLPTEP